MKRTLCILAALLLIVCGAHAECMHNGEKEFVPSKEAENHDVFCTQCQQYLWTESCSADSAWHPTKDEKGHIHICAQCAQQVGAVEKHTPVLLSNGSTICKDCDAVLASCAHGQTEQIVRGGRLVTRCRLCNKTLSSYTPSFSDSGAIDLGGNGSLECEAKNKGSVSLATNASGASLISLTGGEAALNVSGYAKQALSISLTGASLSINTSVPKVYGNLGGDAQSRLSLKGDISFKNIDAYYGSIEVQADANVNLHGTLHASDVVVFEGGMLNVNGLPVPDGVQGDGADDNVSNDVPSSQAGTVLKGEDADAGQKATGTSTGEAKLVLGESAITINGTTTTMDASAYQTSDGFIMVPVEFVAKAFGVSDSEVFANKGSMTFFVGGRSITLTDGSNTALVNGAPVPLPTMTIMKQGRMMGCSEMFSKLLGVTASFDTDTKTLTFTPEN